jgi:hypothetical protein
MKEFYCAYCEDTVTCEEEYIQEGYGDKAGDCKTGYFCPLCGRQMGNEPDPDAEYDRWREQ